MFIVKYRKIFFIISLLLVVGSIFTVLYYGFNFGIDFKGGSILQVKYLEQRPDIEVVRNKVSSVGFDNDFLSWNFIKFHSMVYYINNK
jgi:preprotein translocase subunit SecF